jgi:hypothetical protein
MTAPVSTIDMVNLYSTSSQRLRIRKNQIASGLSGNKLASWWTLGDFPLPGSIPGASAVCTNATTGAIAFTAAAGGNALKIAQFSALTTTYGGTFRIYDRLIHMGGLDGTNTGIQTVNTGTLPADRGIKSDYSDVEAYLEVYTNLGITSRNVQVVYLDALGASKTVTVGAVIPATAVAGQLLRILPNSGDMISAISSVQLSGSTGTAGNFGVTIMKRLVPSLCLWDETDCCPIGWELTGLPRVYDNTCLQIVGTSVSSGALAQMQAIMLLVEATI